MERQREFLIQPNRLMALGMELATVLHSHESMCKWLGPYELDQGERDFTAEYYSEYYDDRVSVLVLSLAVLLRTLDDRKLIDSYTKREDPKNVALGKVRGNNGKWNDITNLRTALNYVIHASEIIPDSSRKDIEISLGGQVYGNREQLSYTGTLTLLGEFNGKPTSMQLDLRAFCDMVFRIAESMANSGGC
jgi:hypothetical protein